MYLYQSDWCNMGSLQELPTCMSMLAFLVYILIPLSNIEVKGL